MRLTDYLSMRIMADGKAGTMTPAMRETERARTRLDEAEAALNGFQMRHGDAVLSEVQQLEQQLRDVNNSLAGATQQQQSLQVDLAAASALKPNDVWSKPLPTGTSFPHSRISGKDMPAPAWRLPASRSIMDRNIRAALPPRMAWMPCSRWPPRRSASWSTVCGRMKTRCPGDRNSDWRTYQIPRSPEQPRCRPR